MDQLKPDPNSVWRMSLHDAMPPDWRELSQRDGGSFVFACYSRGRRIDQVRKVMDDHDRETKKL